jgi:4-amino-4-deoxy-L-arabinose transferase-like glycosyltransferase
MGARLAGPPVGASAAVLLAASPTFLFEVVSPTSDIPCTAWWALGLALLMIERRWAALAAGISVGLAILTRPNLVPLAAVPATLLLWRSIQSRSAQRPDISAGPEPAIQMLLFAAGSVPACIAVAVINRSLYGSAFATGYGPFDALYSRSFFWKNVVRYPTWIVQTQTVLVLLAVVAPFVLKGDRATTGRERHPRTLAIVWLSFIALNVLSYLFYLPWEEWWYVRFLMPAYPPLLALTAATLWTFAAPLDRFIKGGQRLVAATVVAAVSWHGVSFSLHRGAQLQWIAEQRYKFVGAYVDAALPHRAVLICMQHSGSARFYSGRITVRYDVIEPADLALVASQLRQLGYVPYILLDDWEEPQFRARFDGHTPLGRLDWPPIATLDHNRVRIYDTLGR